MLDEVEVAAELQHRVLADRMMRGKKGAEFKTRHDPFSSVLVRRTTGGTGLAKVAPTSAHPRLADIDPDRAASVNLGRTAAPPLAGPDAPTRRMGRREAAHRRRGAA
jgi:hypothetical protein